MMVSDVCTVTEGSSFCANSLRERGSLLTRPFDCKIIGVRSPSFEATGHLDSREQPVVGDITPVSHRAAK